MHTGRNYCVENNLMSIDVGGGTNSTSSKRKQHVSSLHIPYYHTRSVFHLCEYTREFFPSETTVLLSDFLILTESLVHSVVCCYKEIQVTHRYEGRQMTVGHIPRMQQTCTVNLKQKAENFLCQYGCCNQIYFRPNYVDCTNRIS